MEIPQLKQFIAILLMLGLLAVASVPIYAASGGQSLKAGNLDSSFGNSGKVIGPVGDARALVIQADGKIIAAGGKVGGFVLARYNTNGSFDSGFGSGGTVTTSFPYGGLAHSLALQTDGKIVAVGGADIGTIGDSFALVRYRADGSLDDTFGSGGVVTTQTAAIAYDEYLLDIAIQADGKLVVAGTSQSNFVVARYNTDGSLDSTFGGDGIVVTQNAYRASSVAIQSDGKIVAAGYADNGSILARYNNNGTLDNTFGTGGIVVTDIYEIYEVTLQTDGKIIAVGTGFAVSRYHSDGMLDTTFGNGGKVAPVFADAGSDAQSIVIQANGMIVVSGSAETRYKNRARNFYDRHYATARFTTAGVLDDGFGNGGTVITPVGPANDLYADDHAFAVALQVDGKIVVGGRAATETAVEFGLLRYYP